MDSPDPKRPSQRLEYVMNSAVSFSGDAVTYNIAGNQYLSSSAPPKRWTPPLMLPPRAPSFVGREEDLAWLHRHLTTSETGITLAICGPGGIGKTALAAEVLSRLIAEKKWSVHFPDGIFYHSFYMYPSLSVAFEELARIFEETSSGDLYLAARRAVSRRRALLVFDGVENLDDARPLRDLGGKNIILMLSRRRSDASDLAHRRDLGFLPQKQAMALLQELAGPRATDHQSVERLVQQIGGYPLALQLIGSYLSSNQEEITDYLQWFEGEGLAALHFGEHQDQSVKVLLQRTYDSLIPDEQRVFLLLGLLAPAPFPLELVQEIAELPEQAIRRALGSLVNLSLLRRPDLGYEVSHPLVHTFAAERFSSLVHVPSSPFSEMVIRWREQFLNTLTIRFEQCSSYDRSDLALWYPHVLSLVSAQHLTVQQSLRAAHLFSEVGSSVAIQGKYAAAEPLLKRALEVRKQTLEAMHPDLAQSLIGLAVLYRDRGKYAAAEPLLKRALMIYEQELGAAHPNTVLSLNNLGSLYQMQGKYSEAEPLLKRALAIQEQELGTTHLHTAQSLNNLASLYRMQGKYSEAEPLLKRALMIYEQELGAAHPNMVLSLNNLAELYIVLGKYTDAEPLLKRAQGISEQELGATHPHTASSLHNLASLYYAQSKYAAAEPLLKRALAIREQELGPTHPHRAQSLTVLASLYYAQSKYAAAEPLLKQVLMIYEQELGATHPDTASSLNNLAALYHAQGKYADAEPLLKRALTIQEQELGITHPDTANCLHNLGGLHMAQGRYAEAELLCQRALAIYESVLGQDHPSTRMARKNYAFLLRRMKRERKQAGRKGFFGLFGR